MYSGEKERVFKDLSALHVTKKCAQVSLERKCECGLNLNFKIIQNEKIRYNVTISLLQFKLKKSVAINSQHNPGKEEQMKCILH